jgi:hypothetical protein
MSLEIGYDNSIIWSAKTRQERPNLPIPRNMKSITMKELYYSRYYEFDYYITYLRPTLDTEMWYDSFEEIDYHLNTDEIKKICNDLYNVLSNVTKVFEIDIDQENHKIRLYIVPNNIISDSSKRVPFRENDLLRDIILITEYPFRTDTLTDKMIEELREKCDYLDINLTDSELRKQIYGPQYNFEILT